MPRRLRPVLAVALGLVAALCCAGCGLGAGPGSGAVSLRVTENFGARTIRSLTLGSVKGAQTDMQLLERHSRVSTRYGGGFVESVDGHSGTGHRYDWFFYVNGVQAQKGAAATDVHRGDHVWFDLHDWQRTDSIPAVVGSFPEPFVNGVGGRRYPTTLECPGDLRASCASISREFTHLHIPLGSGAPGYGSGPDTLSINVGTWDQLYGEVAAELIKYGPGTSGVYAQFTSGGHALDLENAAGRVVKRLGPDSGLIAATANSQDPAPTWLITGTDRAGVMDAIRALTPQALADHFALAVHGSTRYPVPLG